MSGVNDRPGGYVHHGLVQVNGRVALDSVCQDPELLAVRREENLPHTSATVGNVEIWYFDVMDLSSNVICIIELYWDTDPLKKAVACHAVVFTYTPDQGVVNRAQTFSPEAFESRQDALDIRLGANRVYTKPDTIRTSSMYRVEIAIEDVAVHLDFHPSISGWKPWGEQIVFEDDIRCGAFSWLAPMPRGQVHGQLMIKGRERQLREAVGYYDRTWWNCNGQPASSKQQLFIDDAITRWEWGRFCMPPHSVIFTDLHLRPWLDQPPIRSVMLAENDRMTHSSTNRVRIHASQPGSTRGKRPSVPDTVSIEFPYGAGIASLQLHLKEIIDRQCLLQDLDAVTRTLIRGIFGRPQSYYLLMEGTLSLGEAGAAPARIQGPALYEAMILSERPTKLEDAIRRRLHSFRRRTGSSKWTVIRIL